MRGQDKNSILETKINDLLKDKSLICVEVSIRTTGGQKNIEVFLAQRDNKGVLQSPTLDTLEEMTDILELFFEAELGNSNFDIILSSPGSNRKLKDKEDFKLFVGRDCKITYVDDDLKSYVVLGNIISCSEDSVLIDCSEINSKNCVETNLSIEFSKIKKASLA